MSDAGRGFDDAVDGAVREMLDVEPPAGLRGRVLDRIQSRRSGPVDSAFLLSPVVSAFTRNVWIAAPLAAAIILLVVLAPWRHAVEPAPAAPPLAQAAPRVDIPITTTPRRAPVSPTIATVRVPSATSLARRAVPQRSEERMVLATVAPADSATELSPLAAIAPITVAGTRPDALTTTEIAIKPMAPTTELQIAPLSPREPRN
jgi:hypothetical protein